LVEEDGNKEFTGKDKRIFLSKTQNRRREYEDSTLDKQVFLKTNSPE